MIVLKPTIVKIGKTSYKLKVGMDVPGNVLSFWKESKQLEILKNNGIIGDKKESNNFINNFQNDKQNKQNDKTKLNNEEKK